MAEDMTAQDPASARKSPPGAVAASQVADGATERLAALDAYLAPLHQEGDVPCACDDCMAYGAEDNGADWFRIPAANRIVMRILDSGDARLAPLAQAFRDHEAADAADAALATPETAEWERRDSAGLENSPPATEPTEARKRLLAELALVVGAEHDDPNAHGQQFGERIVEAVARGLDAIEAEALATSAERVALDVDVSAERWAALSDAIYRALRECDRTKRLARDLRMVAKGAGPTIKRGSGRAALTAHLTAAARAALEPPR